MSDLTTTTQSMNYQEPHQMYDLARIVLHTLASHIGPKAYIKRGDLLTLVNAEMETDYSHDRQIRDAIEWLRANHPHGAFISALYPRDGESGYFMARDTEEAREFMKPDWKRYNNLGERLNKQMDLLSGQQVIERTQIGMPL